MQRITRRLQQERRYHSAYSVGPAPLLPHVSNTFHSLCHYLPSFWPSQGTVTKLRRRAQSERSGEVELGHGMKSWPWAWGKGQDRVFAHCKQRGQPEGSSSPCLLCLGAAFSDSKNSSSIKRLRSRVELGLTSSGQYLLQATGITMIEGCELCSLMPLAVSH